VKASVKIEGQEKVERAMAALAKKYGQEMVDAAQASANLVRSEAIKSIQSQSSGRVVTRSREGGGTYEHIASAAGNAPNTDTGRLVGSIQVNTDAKGVTVGTTLEYGRQLEHGTSQMAARPWLIPALENNRRAIEALFKRKIDKITKEDGQL
jgi:phage gpG-like protein